MTTIHYNDLITNFNPQQRVKIKKWYKLPLNR